MLGTVKKELLLDENPTNNVRLNNNFRLLNKSEKNYLFKYHLDIYSRYSKYLNKKEKNWLASLI